MRLLILACAIVGANAVKIVGSSDCNTQPTGYRKILNVTDLGGAPCKYNVQCAPLSSRAFSEARGGTFKAPGLITTDGKCTNGRCDCSETARRCGYCGITARPVNPAATDSTGKADSDCREESATLTTFVDDLATPETSAIIDMCDLTITGSGACTIDEQCGSGLCLKESSTAVSGFCVCYTGYTCPYCDVDVNSFTYGARCPTLASQNSTGSAAAVRSGGAVCTDKSDCGKGTCTTGNDPQGLKKCNCGPGLGCGDCTKEYKKLATGQEQCGCDGVGCPEVGSNTNGYCSGDGKCVCHFPFVGPDCGTNPCFPLGTNRPGLCKKAHTQCVIDKLTSAASCVCQDGYSTKAGEDAEQDGCNEPPACTLDEECGVWGPIPEFADTGRSPDLFGNKASQTHKAGDPFYGGRCEKGKCVCKDGFGCNTCDALMISGVGACIAGNATHAEVKNVTGGGPCIDNQDCSTKGSSAGAPARQGGVCFKPASEGAITVESPGRCICFDGFTCDHCSEEKQDPSGFPGGCPTRVTVSGSADLKSSSAPTRAPTPNPTPKPVPKCGTCANNATLFCSKANESEVCPKACVTCSLGGGNSNFSAGLSSLFGDDDDSAAVSCAPQWFLVALSFFITARLTLC